MNDLEICKRIAEIEGGDWFESEGVISSQNDLGLCREYNPLTDDGLCFRLMVKYGISFWDTGNGYFAAKKRAFGVNPVRRKNPNESICLAIIESHKDA
jgi:hypothetical protein